MVECSLDKRAAVVRFHPGAANLIYTYTIQPTGVIPQEIPAVPDPPKHTDKIKRGYPKARALIGKKCKYITQKVAKAFGAGRRNRTATTSFANSGTTVMLFR